MYSCPEVSGLSGVAVAGTMYLNCLSHCCDETHSENLKEGRVYLDSHFERMQSIMEEKVWRQECEEGSREQ